MLFWSKADSGRARGARPLLLPACALLAAALSPACVTDDKGDGSGGVDSAGGADGAEGSADGAEGSADTGDCPEGTRWDGSACVGTDECAEDNGGCGDPALWSCADTPDAPPSCTFLCGPDHEALADGVSSVDLGGSLPSALVLSGQATCPIMLDGGGKVVVGSGRYGAGRFIEVGHEGLLAGGAGGDGARLAANAARWAAGEGRRAVVEPGLGAVNSLLEGEGFTVSVVGSGPALIEALADADLYVATTYGERSAEEIDALHSFVDAGGGLMLGGHAWWWAYSTGLDPALGYPGNAVLGPMGLWVTAQTTDGGVDEVGAEAASDLLHHRRALDLLLAHLAGTAPLDRPDQVTGAATVGFAISALPLSVSAYFDPARAFLSALPRPVIPTEAAPISPASAPIEGVVLRLESKLATQAAVDEVLVPASAADFPGEPEDGAVVGRISLPLRPRFEGYPSFYAFSGAGSPLWLSTGAWALAGGPVTAQIPAAWAGQGLRLRVGGWTDTLWHLDDWWRNPEISRSEALDAEITELASGFGGLVYLEVPAGVDLPEGELVLDGVVAAPRYVRGETTDPSWAEAPAPWAELEGEHVVLMLPRGAAAEVEDPEALLALWDAVMEAQAALASMPLPRARKERIQLDRQISAGWMHSGYPIMAYTAVQTELSDLDALMSVGSWGAFHELGHNHQHRSAELEGTTEATVNLWSVYAMEEVIGLPRGEAHPALAPAERAARIDAYIAGGSDYAADWSVWTALETYLQVQERFGWAPFQRVFARYRAEPSAPANEQARLDRWATWTSEEVGMDLSGFYRAWGWPLSPSVDAALAGLPDWTDHPLADR
jgi:hypothetical protein